MERGMQSSAIGDGALDLFGKGSVLHGDGRQDAEAAEQTLAQTTRQGGIHGNTEYGVDGHSSGAVLLDRWNLASEGTSDLGCAHRAIASLHTCEMTQLTGIKSIRRWKLQAGIHLSLAFLLKAKKNLFNCFDKSVRISEIKSGLQLCLISII
ncbi:unnamed protein product [Cuscuta europaea]|uniref:Uncharacterized protein n=1 Tax=Cuscuta europaea TaxID=41803 RepID=A0A9P0YV79_CUSEU|nr:unnamed protein product [Cuscuta europaea]